MVGSVGRYGIASYLKGIIRWERKTIGRGEACEDWLSYMQTTAETVLTLGLRIKHEKHSLANRNRAKPVA
jgi:hypothetical protein